MKKIFESGSGRDGCCITWAKIALAVVLLFSALVLSLTPVLAARTTAPAPRQAYRQSCRELT